MVEVFVRELRISENSANPSILVLANNDLKKAMLLTIGAPEAMSLSILLNMVVLPRPLFYDLFINALKFLDAKAMRLEIVAIKDKIFLADLVVKNNNGEEKRLACRPSDGLSIALRDSLPIFVSNHVFLQVAERDREVVVKNGTQEEEWANILDKFHPENSKDRM